MDGIIWSSVLNTIRSKAVPTATIKPNNTGIRIENIINTSWGLGYSKLAFEGEDLPSAGVLAHIRSNLTGTEYEVIYTLPASSDFLVVEVRNTTSNQTTLIYNYRLGNLNTDILKIGGVNETTFNLSAPNPTCFNKTRLGNLFVCSYDESEFSTAKTSGIVYAGDKNYFVSLCNDEAHSTYFFNTTATQGLRVLIPLASATCNTIGNQTSIIEKQSIPSRPFGSYALTGPAKLQISLKYDRIFINGTDRFGPGQHKVCIQKIGRQGSSALVDVRAC